MKSQAVLHTEIIERRYQMESDIAGPKRCGGEAYGVSGQQLQSPPAIMRWLVEQAAARAGQLTVGYDEPRNVLLAVDNELKPGNAHALGGSWDQALETWRSASIKPKDRDTEAARQYNLGVAREALAARAMRDGRLEEAITHLDEAEKCYSLALSLDAGEKYFRDTLRRLQADRAVLRKEQEHEFMKEAALAAEQPAPAAPEAPVSATIPLDGWPEGEAEAVHDFRMYVRTRLAAQKAEVPPELRQRLVASAADYGVKEGTAMQVVDSEAKRLAVLRQNLDKYRDDFKDAAADGTITPDERAMLQKRVKILRLAEPQAKEVEMQFKVRE